ncbi:MAG: hypothetical protein ACRD3E_09165 [Terriglobales bacterium]
MLGTLGIDVLAAIAFLLLWYLIFVRYNRRQAIAALHRMRSAFAGEAQIIAVHWADASQFCTRLRVDGGLFLQPTVRVRLQPRQQPLQWMWSRVSRRQEMMTFEADLECPPSFNLEVHNQRWCGHTRKFPAHHLQRLTLDHCGPFVLTTRNEWQRDIMGMMNALMASRDCDLLSVTYRKNSPHFSASMPLACIASEIEGDTRIFEVLRELASCGQASRF